MSYIKTQGFILKIRSNRLFRFGVKSLTFAFAMTYAPVAPLFGLTSGPSQPEASDFTPAGVDNLVDPFTGDFSYNIPLLEIGGYPINLAYSAGITMDQEASWVGLGWNVSTGAINRTLRGLPDDFNGDLIRNSFNLRDNITISAGVGASGEFFGVPFPGSMEGEVIYNNYNGLSLGTSVNLSAAIAEGADSKLTASLGLKASGNGLDISPGLSFSEKADNTRMHQNQLSLNLGISMNSRQGLGQISFGPSVTQGVKKFLSDGRESRSTKTLLNMSASITFAAPAVNPQIQLPFETHAFTFRGALGLAAFGIDGDITLRGTYSKQALRVKEKSAPCYGYLNLQNGQQNPKAKLDFSRDKDGSFSMTTPYLPQTTLAYDVFNLDAQGLGGSFRAFRNDLGYVFDDQEVNLSKSGTLALELSSSQIVDVGAEVDVNTVESRTGAWETGNLNTHDLRFRKSEPNDIREPWHFRLATELSAESDPTFTNISGGRYASHFENPSVSSLSKKWRNRLGTTGHIDNNYRNARQQRNTHIAYFSIGQLRALYPYIAQNIASNAPRHHLGAFVITTPEGVRYVFGLPAYNWVKNEITFSQGRTSTGSSLTLSPDGTQITYSPLDASINNKRGIDHYYDEVETPAYAYSWYLTEILSPDYVDVTGDGPSEDDLGTYTYFHYGREQTNGSSTPNISHYKWRTPTSNSLYVAGYSSGLLSDITDDKASIIYGEKDVWYLRMIESKTQVAVFIHSDRNDGYGVNNIHGSIGGAALKKLDEIRLYVKEDYLQNGTSAIPTKTVHFDYDYSLCPGVPNNLSSGGKLTLKKVYFTYKGEGRSKFSPYQFTYSTLNPSYSTNSSDRWGNYRPWSNPTLRHDAFPYSDQNRLTADDNAEAWNLTEIETPAGGTIKVTYEADTYGYVQNKQASAMYMALGFTASIDAQNPAQNLSPALMNGLPTLTPRTYLHIDLGEFPIDGGLSAIVAAHKFRNDFVKGWDNLPKGPKKHLYFRFLMNVNHGLNAQNEFVSGYVEPELQSGEPLVGVYKHNSSDYNRAWIKLKEVSVEGTGSGSGANPISKAAWQFSRMYTPRYAFNQPDPTDTDFIQVMKVLANALLIYQIFEFFQGPNGALRNKGFGNEMDPDQSWVRLYVPNGEKVGGGHRVKQVEIKDNWGAMTPTEGSAEATYGQQYFYVLENGRSSGVAAWEPGIGADENSWRVPVFFDTQKTLVPNEKYYQEEPILESQFPGPVVGYSRIKVNSLPRSGVTTTATGYKVHEYYTAKDFPTKVEISKSSQPRRQKSGPVFSLLFSSTFDRVSYSQGFLIELNDMHGKEKATFAYPEGSTIPISGSRYIYKTDPAGNLLNQVQLFRTDGTKYIGDIGVDVDYVADFREHETTTSSIAVAGNVAAFMLGPIPVFVISILPRFVEDEKVFRLATSNKVVRKAGILERVESYDLGAKVVKENEGYDALSGKLILERVNNAYEDTRYASTIPAYWAYSRMGHASSNWGYRFTYNGPGATTYMNFNPVSGQLIDQAYNVLIPGDEISFPRAVKDPDYIFFLPPNNSHTYRLWVSQDSLGAKYLIDEQGVVFNTSHNLWPSLQSGVRQMQVIRSGNRNQPLGHIQKAETMAAPLSGSGDRLVVGGYQGILSISAMEYDEFWKNNDNRLYNYKDTLGLVCISYPHVQRTIELLNAVIDDPNLSLVSPPSSPPVDLSQIFPHLTSNLIGGSSSNPYYYYPGTLWHAGYFDVTVGDWETPCLSYMNFLRADNSMPLTPTEIASLTGFDIGPVFHLPPNLNPYQNINWWYDGTVLDFFSVIAHFNDGSTLPMYIVFDECSLVTQECEFVIADYPCLTIDSAIVNPYLYGFLGNWRPVRNYAYLTERGPAGMTPPAKLRGAGTYLNFAGMLWEVPTTFGMPWVKSTVLTVLNHWQLANEIANYNQFGAEIENKDALGNFTAALYGYKHTLPVGVASNARYQEIAFDGFEDYYPGQFVDSCDVYHFKFTPYKHLISRDMAHSGRHSLRIRASQTVELFSQVSPQLPRRNTYSVPYRIWPEDLLGLWRPRETNTSQRYVCSFWIRPDTSNLNMLLTYQNDFSVGIDLNSTALNPVFQNWGPIIEGWQQVETHFVFPASLTNGDIIRFFVHNNTSDQAYFFDDFRLQPFNSSMMTYVYDPVDFMYMASLDENNFASFYEYDREGKLIRVKKETQRGVSTLQEIRNNRPKKP